MKWREILAVPAKKPELPVGKQITAQTSEHYLILDLWEGERNRCRYAMNLETKEPGTYYPDTMLKTAEGISRATGHDEWYSSVEYDKDWFLTPEDREIIKKNTNAYSRNVLGSIASNENSYRSEVYTRQRDRKEKRIRDLMDTVPDLGTEVDHWITQKLAGDLHYAFWHKNTRTYHCTACNRDFPEAAGKERQKHGKETVCPLCGHVLMVEKKKISRSKKGIMTIIQNLDDKRGIERHFAVEICWEDKRTAFLDEQIRLMMQRGMRDICKIYYADFWGNWSGGNRCNRRWKKGYLFPDREGIRAGLKGTAYEKWSDVFPLMAELGIEANYNTLMVESNTYWAGMIEYMAKGRFYRLIGELSEQITYWGGYRGTEVMPGAGTIEETLKLKDRQLINRLRQENGGVSMLSWLQWSERTHKKISSECMEWLEKTEISAEDYNDGRTKICLSPEQLMHYINRQCKESYHGKSPKTVWNQYEDYLSVAAHIGKNIQDELVYRPRELKRRHDEVNEEARIRTEELRRKANAEAAKAKAEQMRQKYPGYEDILAEVKEKYEYGNETYQILVPKDFSEITEEGMALHHCVGNTERYFDRIVSRETYICFLRKKEALETPYYTIEVEPGGTIRQHRGYLDEEPEIEQVKPFLREWQKVIRRRMSRQDYEYAKTSEILRQKNIEELKEKKNTRVLNGLMEDLMEVI